MRIFVFASREKEKMDNTRTRNGEQINQKNPSSFK